MTKTKRVMWILAVTTNSGSLELSVELFWRDFEYKTKKRWKMKMVYVCGVAMTQT